MSWQKSISKILCKIPMETRWSFYRICHLNKGELRWLKCFCLGVKSRETFHIITLKSTIRSFCSVAYLRTSLSIGEMKRQRERELLEYLGISEVFYFPAHLCICVFGGALSWILPVKLFSFANNHILKISFQLTIIGLFMWNLKDKSVIMHLIG